MVSPSTNPAPHATALAPLPAANLSPAGFGPPAAGRPTAPRPSPLLSLPFVVPPPRCVADTTPSLDRRHASHESRPKRTRGAAWSKEPSRFWARRRHGDKLAKRRYEQAGHADGRFTSPVRSESADARRSKPAGKHLCSTAARPTRYAPARYGTERLGKGRALPRASRSAFLHPPPKSRASGPPPVHARSGHRTGLRPAHTSSSDRWTGESANLAAEPLRGVYRSLIAFCAGLPETPPRLLASRLQIRRGNAIGTGRVLACLNPLCRILNVSACNFERPGLVTPHRDHLNHPGLATMTRLQPSA